MDSIVTLLSGSFLIPLARMEAELEQMLGRHVDLLTRKAVEQSRNYIRKQGILSSLEKVYGV